MLLTILSSNCSVKKPYSKFKRVKKKYKTKTNQVNWFVLMTLTTFFIQLFKNFIQQKTKKTLLFIKFVNYGLLLSIYIYIFCTKRLLKVKTLNLKTF